MTLIEKLEAMARWRMRSSTYRAMLAKQIAQAEADKPLNASDTHTYARTLTHLLHCVTCPEEYAVYDKMKPNNEAPSLADILESRMASIEANTLANEINDTEAA